MAYGEDDAGTPSVIKAGAKLGDILALLELFEAYPQLKEINLKLLEGSSNRGVGFETNTISLQSDAGVSTLIHEIQHAVDTIEGYDDDGSNIYQAGKLLDLMLDDKEMILLLLVRCLVKEKEPRTHPETLLTGGERTLKKKEKPKIRQLAEERLETAMSKNAGEIHALFQLTRMFETFATVIRKAELPASQMTENPRPSQLILVRVD